MRINYIIAILILFAFASDLSAQKGASEIIKQFEAYHGQLMPEKVYIQTNREGLTLGDTLYFSAYVVNGIDHTPTPLSGVLHGEWISSKGDIIASQKLKIDSLGRAFGDFVINDSLDAGLYTLRAYTRYQMNFDQEYFFSKQIKVLPRTNEQNIAERSSDRTPQVNLTFFPEGGELVAGAANIIAFKATDQYGNPMDIEGNIFDDTNENVASISCDHDGMGVVQVLLEEGKKYTCIYQFADRSFSQPLPRVLPAGYLLRVRNVSGRWHTEVRPTKTSIENTFLVVQCRGEILYVIGPQPGAQSIRFSLKDTDLPNGIIQLTFFDPQNRAVAERLIYNENPQDQTTLQLKTDKQTYAKRSNVNLELELKKSDGNTPELASLSTTVVPRHLRITPNSNIASFFFLTSDLKGYVHDPDYYINPQNPYRLRHMDLLMMTHGWRRFDWEQIIEGKSPEISFFPEKGIRIEGTVTRHSNRKKPVVSDLYLRFIEDPIFQLATRSSESGFFWFDGLNFSGKLSAYIKTLSDNQKRRELYKKKSNTFIRIHEQTIPTIQENYHSPFHASPTDRALIARGERLFDISSTFDSKTIVLDEIRIEETRIDTQNPFKNRQGLFYEEPDHRVYLDSIPSIYNNIFQYLLTVPGVMVEGSYPEITVTIRDVSLKSPTKPLYLLNGIPIEEEEDVNRLNVYDILFIDVLKGPSASVYGSRGAGGVIAMYSRGAGDFRPTNNSNDIGLTIFPLMGYAAPRRFYMPDYSNPTEKERIRPDYRSTLYWNPLLKIEGGQGKDQFYTSDETGEFVVFTEGMTIDGKVFYGTCTFDVQ